MGTLANAPAGEGLQQIGIQERSALIDRIAASTQFRRSARLREFLLYVGRQSLKEGCPDIHEQEIGARVFGRPANYDRSQDNIVRVNATELRKRIDQYFITEGAHETIVMEIPRGGYRPVFHRRSTITAPTPVHDFQKPQVTTAVEGAHRPEPRIWNWLTLLFAASTALLVIAGIYLLVQNRELRQASPAVSQKPIVESFWHDFQKLNPATDIVLPDDSLSLIEDLTNQPVSFEDYLSRNFMREVQSSDKLSADRKYDLSQVFSHNLITFGGVRAAQAMMPYMVQSPVPRLTLSRYYEGDSFKQHNVILIGGRKANPWVHFFDDQINFVTDFDNVRGQAVVLNRQPKPGEQLDYRVPFAPNTLTGYSVIAYLPNPSHTGNAIILAGTDSDATSAAAEFLTSENQLRKLESTLHLQKLPYFEVLLKTSRISGTSLSAELLAYRTYPDLH